MSDIKDPKESLLVDGTEYVTNLTRKFRNRKPFKPADPKQVIAYIPGLIVKVLAKDGQQVKRRDGLLILEAMKMQNEVGAPLHGVVKKILVKEGDIVAKGDLLAVME